MKCLSEAIETGQTDLDRSAFAQRRLASTKGPQIDRSSILKILRRLRLRLRLRLGLRLGRPVVGLSGGQIQNKAKTRTVGDGRAEKYRGPDQTERRDPNDVQFS